MRTFTTAVLVAAFCLPGTGWANDDHAIPTARSMGALADGRNDDTAAIQAAVDLGRGGVRFMAGRFRITEPITIDLQKLGFSSVTGSGATTIVMAGAGPAFRIVGHHDGTASPATVQDHVWDRERTPVVEGIEIVGDHPEADGIELNGTMQAIVSKVSVREARHGVHLVNRNRNVIITACHLYDNTGVGVFLDRVNLHQFILGDTHVSYNDGGGVVVAGGNVRNIHIGNCDLEGNMPDDDRPTKAANVLIDHTHDPADINAGPKTDTVAEITITGCTIQHSAKNVSSANVRLIGREDYPLNTVSISANVMSDANRSVDVEHVSALTMVGNVFFNAPTDIDIRNSRRINLTGNTFDPRRYIAQRAEEGGVVIADCSEVVVNALQMFEISSVEPALALRRCQRVIVTSCQLHECASGILLDECTNCIVANNMVTGTGADGVSLDVASSQSVQLSSNVVGESE